MRNRSRENGRSDRIRATDGYKIERALVKRRIVRIVAMVSTEYQQSKKPLRMAMAHGSKLKVS